MNLKHVLYSPEGDPGAGGGGAGVAEPPTAPAAPQGGQELSDMSMGDAIAKVFKTDKRQTDRREPRKEPAKNEPKTPPAAPAPKAEEKPAPVAPPKSEKRTSIFDEAPSPTTAPTAPAPAAPEEIPHGNWEAANKARDELRTKLKTVESELATYHELVPDREEIKRIRDEHKVYSDRIAVLDYQNHPDFKRQFTEPKAKLTEDMGAILKDNNIEGFDIRAIAALPRADMSKAITEVTAKMNAFDQGEFRLQLREYQKIASAEQAALGNHKDAITQLTQQAQAKQRTAFEGKWKTTSLATFAQKLEPPADSTPEEVAQIRALNQGIESIRGTAEKYAFGLGDEAQAADIAIKASNYDFVVNHAFPRMASDYKKLQSEYSAAIQQLKDLKGQKPGTNFDGSPPAGGDEDKGAQDIKTLVRRTFRT